MEHNVILPAEWYPQSAVQLTWPHENTDWAPILDEVIPCFVSIAKEVIKHEKLLIVCPDEQVVRRQLGDVDDSRIIFREMATNDTWARDHGGITVFDQGEPAVYDFGFERILWLENGYLAGDDTDSHVDTLARFCSEDTIAYVQCTDESDEHFEELQAMEQELLAFKQADGRPYRLIALPMADPVVWEGERLPATYANFLIINGAVLLPYYKSPKDELAKKALQQAFPDREIIGINCLPLIKQHGSLHCVTMQYPEGVI